MRQTKTCTCCRQCIQANGARARAFDNGKWTNNGAIWWGSNILSYWSAIWVLKVCRNWYKFLRTTQDANLTRTIIDPRTAGSLFNLPATSVSSTFLQALHNLMYGVEFWSVPGLRATSHSSIGSTATWMRHVLGPHVSCGDC